MRYTIRILPILLTFLLLVSCSQPTVDAPSSPTASSVVLLPVEPICQFPDFPTGCEATATVTALQYIGVDISVDGFIDRYLPAEDGVYRSGFQWYGPDPSRVFVGDPRSTSGYGCFSSVILKSLYSFFGSQEQIEAGEQLTMTELCERYIDHGTPVILWASSQMQPLKDGQRWQLPDGRQFTWPSGEHCLVLVGYSDTEYFFCDPKYTEVVSYERWITEQRYTDMGRQYIAVLPKE